MKLIYLIAILVLGSCSAQWHIKKAIQKDPSILKQDTIIFTDSINVITKEVHTDSVFMVGKDTVTIVKDNLTIRHYYNNDSIWIYGECASDTIVRWKTFEVPVEKVVYNESWFPKWLWIVGVLLVAWLVVKKYLLPENKR